MGGTINDSVQPQTFTGGNLTTTNCYPYGGVTGSISYYPWYVATPVECSGDVHVFPCPHCEKCKCGKATVKREKKK